MNKVYELHNINKKYQNYDNEIEALHNVNLTIYEKNIIVILGPSGSGKSTLLNILSNIDIPTSGKVLFEGTRIDNYNEEESIMYRRNNLGFIFQSYNLIANLTVKENIELGYNLGQKPMDIDRIMKTMGLEDQKHKYPYQLSGGQMQRVAIARAIVKNPKVLFCDEPTGALDEKNGKIILSLLKEINKEYNTTIIIVTHNQSIAEMANVVIKMNSGKIISVTTNEYIKDVNELGWA